MRVLIDYRPALRQRTGVGEYAHQLAAALVPGLAPGDQLVLFSSSWKDRLPRSPVPGATVADARVPVRLLNLAWHRLQWPPIERLAGPVDVAHSMHPLLMPARRAAQVITIHDLHFLDDASETAGEIRRDYAALAGPHARRADAVIAISQHTADQAVSRLGIARDRLTVCCPGAPDWPARPGPNPGGPILFLGTIEPRKNVATLLHAYARLLSNKAAVPSLVLAGRAGRESGPVLARIAEPPLAGRVRHLGYVTDDHRQALYRDASMVVIPSLDEGFGLPALEAMTVGVPVVAAARGALPEVLGGAGLLVDPLSDQELAAAMRRLLEDESLAGRCIRAGLERARHYRWDTSARALLGAYREALARRGSRGA